MSDIKMQRIIKILTALILVLFVFLIFAQADKKFTLDELDFPIVAKATSETGVPIYYRGEATPRHLGLYHPPLYIYALAAQIKLFGFSENTVRAFGMICTLLTAYLMLIMLRLLSSDSRNDLLGLIFLACYLFNPYTIANSTLPDIDSTILPPLITLFTLFLFKKKNDFSLAFVFCILLWAKLTTPLALIPFSIIYWKSNNETIKNILTRAVLVFGGGGILFYLTYWIYCQTLNLPINFTFTFLIHSFTKGSASPDFSLLLNKIQANFSYTKNLLMAIGLPTVFLFFTSAFFIATQKSKSIDRKNALFLSSLCISVTLFYCSLISPFGGFFKYPFPIFQFICVVVSLFILECLKTAKNSDPLKTVTLASLVFVFCIFQASNFTEWSDLKTKEATFSICLIFLISCIFLGFAISVIQNNFLRILPQTVAILFVATLGINFGIARYQATSPFSTKYSYGQLGMEETISYLKSNIRKNELIWSMKDIGFYAGNHYIENYDVFFSPKPEEDIRSAIHSGARFFVATQGVGEDRIDVYTNVRNALEACCRLDKNFGNFYIYVPK